MAYYLSARDICFKYFKESKLNVVDHTSLDIEKGTTTVITGASGCGKSTIASILSGLYPQNNGLLLSGNVKIMGQSVQKLSVPQRAGLMTLMFQNPDLQFCMNTLRKEMIFCLENLSVKPSEMDKAIKTFAERYDVTGLLDRNLGSLSGGEKQKAALCCLLLMNSCGIILDEPFANIDFESVADIISLLKKHKQGNGTTLIAIDHRLDYWLDFADEIIVLGTGGRILARGINAQNIADYRSLFEREGLFYPNGKPAFIPKGFGQNDKTPSVALSLNNVSLGYGKKPLLKAANANFYEGGMYAIFGASGSGKTSLFSAILGQKGYKGTIALNGQDISKIKQHELFALVSVVFQNPANQFVALNVLDEVKKSIKLWNKRSDEKRLDSHAIKLLEKYGLKRYQKYSPYMLSQGQQRRLAVLSVLAGKQKILLLDEPTYGQDQKNTSVIMAHLRALCDKNRLTVLFSTHDKDTAISYSDGIFELKDGELLQWQAQQI